MKTNAIDLEKEYPRSPKEKLGPYVHLARMLDKARAKEAETIGDYIYPCPLDQALLEFLDISGEAFYEAAKEGDDSEVLNWVQKHGKGHDAVEIEEWNETFLNRRPSNDESMRRFLETRKRVAPGRTDIKGWIDLLDLEEGRQVP
jgi:hypothetical protein